MSSFPEKGIKDEIGTRCNYLLELINEYSLCGNCGQVIRNKSLLVPDEINPGTYRSLCPVCKEETHRYVFPPENLKPLFEMIAETVKMKRPILVLVLSRTIFEVMVDGLLYRLMECRATEPEIIETVVDRVRYEPKLKIITDITGKTIKELAKNADYNGLMATLNELNMKRNYFLHEGITTKPLKATLSGNVEITQAVPLSDEDMLKAVNFTIDTIDFFAKVFSDYGKPIDIYEKFYADS